MIRIACQTAKLLKSRDFRAPNRWFDTLIWKNTKKFKRYIYINILYCLLLIHFHELLTNSLMLIYIKYYVEINMNLD